MNFEQTAEIAEYAKAMSKAQASMSGPTKDKINLAFKSKYATLDSTMEAARNALSSFGFSISQPATSDGDGYVVVITQVTHDSGQYMRSWCKVRQGKDDAQGFASAVTLLRRHCLLAMIGMAPEDDDDGNAASSPPAARNVSGYGPGRDR